ncbi:hypothetical protein [Dactylosporangium sp. NPDC051541]|uniref:hypothetical protein n=1 Tax=Dactylosporangium sp. NPDC051541 TaxID=3363977 RepID=UPI0037B3EF7D
MTVMLPGLPAPYRVVPESLRRILVMSCFATNRAVDQLAMWAGERRVHAFDGWPAAVKAAMDAVGDRLREEVRPGLEQELLDLVYYAARAVQGFGDQDFAGVLRVGHLVPVLNRRQVTPVNVTGYAERARVHVTEPELVTLLVHEPYLAAHRPTIAAPSSTIVQLDAVIGSRRISIADVDFDRSGGSHVDFGKPVDSIGEHVDFGKDVDFGQVAALLTEVCFAEACGRHEVIGALRMRRGSYLAACRLRADFPGLAVELG